MVAGQMARPRVKSYFDSATGTVFYDVQIPKSHAAHGLAIDLSSGPTRTGDHAAVVAQLGMAMLQTEFLPTLLHEWHHFLQLIAYPFRYLQACRELKLAVNVAESVRLQPDIRFRLHELPVNRAYREVFRAPVRAMRIIEWGDYFSVAEDETPADQCDHRDISETYLAEEATNIFVYRQTGGKEDGRAYSQWLQRSNTYEVCFRFLERVWDADEAYLALTPLVQASFFTTEPCAGFVALVNYCLQRGLLPSRLGVDEFYNRLIALVSRLQRVYPDADAPRETEALGKFHMIALVDYLALVDREVIHPAMPIAKLYAARLRDDPRSLRELLHPLPETAFRELRQRYMPTYTSFRIRPEGSPGFGSVVIPNDLLVGPVPDGHPYGGLLINGKPPAYAQAALEVQRLKDLGFSLVTRSASRIEHRCPHTSCPIYPTGASRRWFPVPPTWQECPFPGWFAYYTAHMVDPETSIIEPMGKRPRASRRARQELLASWPDGWKGYLSFTGADWLRAGSTVVMYEHNLRSGTAKERYGNGRDDRPNRRATRG